MMRAHLDLYNSRELAKRISFPFNMFFRELTIEDYFDAFFVKPEPDIKSSLFSEDALRTNLSHIFKKRGITVLTGPLGSGKSTLLMKIYLDHIQHLNEVGLTYRVDIVNFSSVVEDETLLNTAIEDHTPLKYLFIDSLDETLLGLDDPAIQRALGQIQQFENVLIACRTPFFHDWLERYLFHAISTVIHIQPLTEDEQMELIRHYIKALYPVMRSEAFSRMEERSLLLMQRCRGHVSSHLSIVCTPLFSALIAVSQADNQKLQSHRLANVVFVYGFFVNQILKRVFSEKIQRSDLSDLANKLFERKNNCCSLHLMELDSPICELGDQLEMVCILREGVHKEASIIVDFRHRSIQEFLIAAYTIDRMLTDESLDSTLDKLFNYETSFFIRGLIAELTEYDANMLRKKLEKYSIDNISTRNNRRIKSCNNAIYFASSFNHQESEIFLRNLAELISISDASIDPVVYGTILSRLVASSHKGMLRRFVDEIDNNSKVGVRTLNYYLLYHGDSEPTRLKEFTKIIHPGQMWEATRQTLIERINTVDEKRVLFKAVDLAALRKLSDCTRYKFNKSEIASLRAAARKFPIWMKMADSAEIREAISEQFSKLASLIGEPIPEITEETILKSEDNTEHDLYNELIRLNNSEIDEIIFKYKVPREHLASTATVSNKATYIVQYAKRAGAIDMLAKEVLSRHTHPT